MKKHAEDNDEIIKIVQPVENMEETKETNGRASSAEHRQKDFSNEMKILFAEESCSAGD